MIALLLSISVMAQTKPIIRNPGPPVGVDLKFMGNVDCGSWPKGGPANLEKAASLNIVLGFLAGRSTLRNIDTESNVSHASISAWIDKYCSENPLNTLWDASGELEKQLLIRVGYPESSGQ